MAQAKGTTNDKPAYTNRRWSKDVLKDLCFARFG
jgi:hypothetical protein